jgi:hypothetical protein
MALMASLMPRWQSCSPPRQISSWLRLGLAPHAHPDLAIELDRDFRRHFFNGSLNFIRSVGQAVYVDVYTYAASDTAQVLA